MASNNYVGFPPLPNQDASKTQKEFKTPNAMINQYSDDNFVHISLIIPGLRVKRQLNLSKAPKNGRVLEIEYKKHSVMIKFVLNEGRLDEVLFKYENDEPFNGQIEEAKSYIKYDENAIDLYVRKVNQWKHK